MLQTEGSLCVCVCECVFVCVLHKSQKCQTISKSRLHLTWDNKMSTWPHDAANFCLTVLNVAVAIVFSIYIYIYISC